MLRALEEEHFDQLPGGIFNKGFIRAYARCLGMDEDQAVADYLVASGATPLAKKSEINDEAPLPEPPPPREENSGGGLPWGTFAVLLLIIALGFAGWGFYSRESERADREASTPAAKSSSASPTAAAEPSPSELKPAASADSSASAPQTDQPPPAPKSEAEPTPSPAASAAALTPAATPPQPVPANSALKLVITAREDSWLSVSVDGEIVTRSLLSAPAQKSIRAQNEIVVRAGNVGALDFEFNGKKLPTQGDYGEAKTLTFDAHGMQLPTSKPDAPAQPPQ
jgi:cytoskeletal protein RodZ